MFFSSTISFVQQQVIRVWRLVVADVAYQNQRGTKWYCADQMQLQA